MKILFIASGNQQIASIMCALDRMGHETGMYPKSIETVDSIEDEEKRLKTFLMNNKVDFVISNLFAPVIARLTWELEIKYAVYGMDSPMYETYLPVIPRYDNCYLFFFDKREYQMARRKEYTNVYYLPLAADVAWTESLVITDEEIRKYGCDMSFVGSLYSNNIYDRYSERFSDEAGQIFSEIMDGAHFSGMGRTDSVCY